MADFSNNVRTYYIDMKLNNSILWLNERNAKEISSY